ALVLDVYTGKKTFGTCTWEACQYEGFLTSVKPCGVKLPSFIGPVPTGLGSANVAGSLIDFQMCSGTIAVPAMDCRLGNCGVGKGAPLCCPDGSASCSFPLFGSPAALFSSKLRENHPPAGANGWASSHSPPGGTEKGGFYPPLDHA